MGKIVAVFRRNYVLYLIEAWGLGTFMVSACLFTILLQHPVLKLVYVIPSDFVRRVMIGIAMGATAVGIIYSAWGRRSGAQINPSVTLTMLMLKKISLADALFYILFQLLGGALGVCLVDAMFPAYLSHPSVNYVVTIPGKEGVAAAMVGETVISFLMMFITLLTSNAINKKTQQFTGYVTGLLIISFVTFEAPYSGFSMNPARTIASAIPSHIWRAWPLYMIVSPFSMLCAALLYNKVFDKREPYFLKHYLTPKKTHTIK